MIIVIEGISASGKSTWCAAHDASHIVRENAGVSGAPSGRSDPDGVAAFWADLNAKRWQAALVAEEQTSLAICDTDPLKLHYTWCLHQIGEATKKEWRSAVEATRVKIERCEIGFADAYFVKKISPEAARAQAMADSTRSRRRFELHVRLQPSLLKWYETLDTILPGRVAFGLPDELPARRIADRFPGVHIFDAMIAALPGSP